MIRRPPRSTLFPTRRSSDLSASSGLLTATPRAARDRRCGRSDLTVALEEGDIPPVESEEDRKSTRLNSSHPSISYAVFCLKKKNKLNANPTTTEHTTRPCAL